MYFLFPEASTGISSTISTLMRASGKGYRIAGSLENTDRIMKDTFWIGVYPGMTDEMLQAMADAIKDALN